MKLLIVVITAGLIAGGCSKEDSGTTPTQTVVSTTTESQLYILGKSSVGFTFYKNSTDTLNKGGNSGHPDARLRTRYNAIAAQFLDASGKVKMGTIFPDSSLIVKELYTGSTLTTYVFLFKKKNDANADANGWVWAETSPSGSSTYPVTNKGAGCIGCHSTGIDYTRMNDAQR
jgi:hypothetical protein